MSKQFNPIVSRLRRWLRGARPTAFAIAAVAAFVIAAEAGEAPWTTRTSIGVSYVQRGDGFTWFLSQPGEAIHFSGDKRYFFFTTRRGDLDCDCNIFDLKVFESAQVKAALLSGGSVAPLRSYTLRSRYHKGNEISGLEQARWLGDGKTIGFLAAEGDAAPQVATLDVLTGETKTLSNTAFGVISFDASGGSLIYRGITERKRLTKLKTYPAVAIEPFDMREIVGLDEDPTYRVLASYKGGPAADVAPSSFDEMFYPFNISPDGHYAIGSRAIPSDDEPKSWRAFGVPDAEPGKPAPTRVATLISYQYVLIDLEKGKARPLVDAPTGSTAGIFSFPSALWSPDSRHVVVLNTMLPLGPAGRNMTSYIIDYDVERGTWKILETLKPSEERGSPEITWAEPGKSVLVKRVSPVSGDPPQPGTVISLADGSSMPEAAKAAASDDFAVDAREDVNTPPVIVASAGGKEIKLTPVDPVVAAARLAKVELVTWTDKLGTAWTGGVTMPTRKTRGKVPLVVQSYDFPTDRFLPDGWSTTAFSMQALAAQGIAVVQMGQPRTIVNEGPPFVEAIDSAVEMAAAKFGIDPANVGLVGFSRSGGRTSYAITHPGRIKLAAAVAADGGDANFNIYLNFGVTYPGTAKVAQRTLEMINGGTFWADKKSWLERAPGFNLDRVETPFLITSAGPFAFLSANEMYTGLQLLNKPVELIMFPEGAHQLMAPKERLASMDATVDWMNFWLQGREDRDPSKAGQYARWRTLRALQASKSP